MAASDPSPSVATPTGTLQGVAAFSWDGSVWQPSGRAGPSVATPTGVLQGVAPFAWSGSAWTPVGRAQPGVATLSGVLDGVAVYTWSGSAWTPTGGTATTATPTGALRGVAAFSWDGAAWQPSAQARPSVATPYGVLDGVAFFNWSGTTWAAGAAVPAGATLDLSFMSGTLDPRLTFTRASTATYFDSSGVMQTAAINAPRFDCDPVTHAALGLLIEEQRANAMLWSRDFTNAVWAKGGLTITQSGVAPDGTSLNLVTENTATGTHNTSQVAIALTAVPWTFSVFVRGGTQRYVSLRGFTDGSGNLPWITLDTQTGTIQANAAVVSSGVTAVGGGTYRIWLSQTCQANANGGLLVAGSNVATAPGVAVGGGNSYTASSQTWYVWGFQAEAGAFPTSYIPTTAAAVARNSDQCSIQPAQMGFYTPPGGSWMVELVPAYFPGSYPRVVFLWPTVSGAAPVMFDTSVPSKGGQYDGTSILTTVNATPAGAVAKIATTATATVGGQCLNGGAVSSAALAGGGYPTLGTTGVGFLCATGASPSNTVGYIRRVRYWPRVLSNAELQQVTT